MTTPLLTIMVLFEGQLAAMCIIVSLVISLLAWFVSKALIQHNVFSTLMLLVQKKDESW